MNITQLISVLGVSLIPTIVLVSLILYSDRKSREPLFLILICIFSGIFTIFLSLLMSRLVLPNLSNFNMYINEDEYLLFKEENNNLNKSEKKNKTTLIKH